MFEVDGCWKKLTVCAGEVPRKIKWGAVSPKKREAISCEHSKGVQGYASPRKFWNLEPLKCNLAHFEEEICDFVLEVNTIHVTWSLIVHNTSFVKTEVFKFLQWPLKIILPKAQIMDWQFWNYKYNNYLTISNIKHSSLLQTGLPCASVQNSKLPNEALLSFRTADHSGSICRYQNGKFRKRQNSSIINNRHCWVFETEVVK